MIAVAANGGPVPHRQEQAPAPTAVATPGRAPDSSSFDPCLHHTWRSAQHRVSLSENIDKAMPARSSKSQHGPLLQEKRAVLSRTGRLCALSAAYALFDAAPIVATNSVSPIHSPLTPSGNAERSASATARSSGARSVSNRMLARPRV